MGDAGLHRTGATIGWKISQRATSGNAIGVARSGTSTRKGSKGRKCQRAPLEATSTCHSSGSTARQTGGCLGVLERAHLNKN